MTPPIDNQNCPPEIKAHPIYGDKCSDDSKPYVHTSQRYHAFSIAPEINLFSDLNYYGQFHRIWGGSKPDYTRSLVLTYRPALHFGVGAQFGSNFKDETQAYGRLQLSEDLQRHGLFRGTFALMAGIKHYSGKDLALTDSDQVAQASGNLFSTGGEMALDILFTRWLSISAYMRVLYTPAGSATRDAAPQDTVSVHSKVEFPLGLRLSLDLF
jgi:hypothetical protein